MLAGISGPNLSADAAGRIKASALNTPQHVIVSAMEGMADPSIWGEDKINVPVLAIMAKNPFFGPDLEQTFRGIAPNLDFQMWEGVGHFIMMEKPKEFNAAVLMWLDKNNVLKKYSAGGADNIDLSLAAVKGVHPSHRSTSRAKLF